MNILFLDQFGMMGGGQRSLLELLPAVRRYGWGARVILPGNGSFSRHLRADGFEVDFLHSGEYTPARKSLRDCLRYAAESLPAVNRLLDITRKHRTNLLYVNGPRLLPAAAMVGAARSIPVIFHSHHRILQPIAARLAGTAMRWSRASLIGCCRYAVEPLLSHVPEARRRVIYNGVARPAWPRGLRRSGGVRNIGVIGRVEPEKGQLEFVEAARILAAELPDCHFSVIGAPLFSGPEYLEQVKTRGRGLPIRFPGWQENIGHEFAELDLLVVPSSPIDSTPRVVLEAFAAQIPVLAFPAGGIPELVDDGKTGFLAAGTSAEALAQRIRFVLSMKPRTLAEVTARAAAAWGERFTLERYQDQVIEAITDAMHGSSAISLHSQQQAPVRADAAMRVR